MPDQTSFWAAIATIVVWVAMTAISVMFLLMMRPDAILAAVFLASMAGIGVAGTHVVWDNVVKLRRISTGTERYRREGDSDSRRRATSSSSKAKRERADRGRLDRLIETLDDDEIIELESLLMSRGIDDSD